MKKILAILTATFVVGFSAINAEEMEKGSHEEHGHEHHISIFWGATTFLETSETTFTTGLDYEYRLPFLNRLLGVGVLGDFSFGKETSAVFAGFVGIHPVAGLKILIAPGAEVIFPTDLLPNGASEFALRGSIGYDIMINRFSITPIVSVDWIPATNAISLVYGIATGIGF